MTDQELLEFAAKATGDYYGEWSERTNAFRIRYAGEWREWNPLTDDGDALRLAVRLGLQVDVGITDGDTTVIPGAAIEKHNGDPLTATRRAIVRAAAEIGKAMP